ncbi:unnamed protein product [Calypogeia fissa]
MGRGGSDKILSHVTSETDWQFINEDLRKNGVKVNTDEPGLAILKHIGLEMEMSPNVCRGRFVVDERSCQPFGVLHGGMTGLIAETMASKTGHYAANGQPVQSIELNANHIRAVPIGEKVVVIAKPLMKGGRIQVWEVKFEKEVRSKTGGPPQMAVSAVCKVTLLVGSAIEPVDWKTNVTGSRL